MWSKIKSALGLGLGEVEAKMAVDHQDPRKRFAWAILAAFPNANADPAYRPKFANTALREWYGMNDHDELLENIDFYIEGTGGTVGYDLYRAVFMARAGFGAGMLSEAESWDAAFKVIRKLQSTYPSWNEYGRDFLAGTLDYRKESGDDQDALDTHRHAVTQNLAELGKTLWSQVPFNTPV
ncbi:MAG TPA: DUF1266 domain-containing protein [Polyangiaceae bacterium]|jgi:hypothetical protein|nr:DUF1266 domain-containing protein [Polyangiaceae bacterium]